jgi:hypothetical protein
MSRRSTPRNTLDERRFPLRLRVAVPPGGFGARLDEMHTWLAMRCGRDGYALWSAAGPGAGDATLVYLADLETAAAFVAAFGLELAGG